MLLLAALKLCGKRGAALYVIYVDDCFYCTCETLSEAKYEVRCIEEEELNNK